MPKVDSIAQLNEMLAAADAKDDHRRIANRATTVRTDFLVEAALLRPLPLAEFPTWLTLEPRVDRYARVTVRQCCYSVPAKVIGRRVQVRLGACTVTIFSGSGHGHKQVAQHERVTVRGEHALNLDHYLEVLQRKPGALPGATALVQARASGAFTQAHDAFWAAARHQLGDAQGTRALVEALLLHRHLPAKDVIGGTPPRCESNRSTPTSLRSKPARGGPPERGPPRSG